MSEETEKTAAGHKAARRKAQTNTSGIDAIDLPATEIAVTPIAEKTAEPTEAALPAPEEHAASEAKAPPETESVAPPPAETAPEQTPVPPPARAPSSGWLMPGAIGLIAGLVGGIGGYKIAEFARPKSFDTDTALVTRLGALEQRLASASVASGKPGEAAAVIPQAVLERLERAEIAIGNVSKGHETFGTELGKLGTALKAEVAERRKALENLPSPQQAVGLLGQQGQSELEGLKSRLGSIEGLQPKLDSVASDLQAMSGRIAGLSGREALGAANARLSALALLEDAAQKGRPLGEALELVKTLGAEPAKLAPLADFATSGIPDAKKLLAEFRTIALPAAQKPAQQEQSLVERMKQGALSLVEVRKAGEVTGSDDTATIARIGEALARGEIAAANTLIGKLSAGTAPVYAAWKARLETRAKAFEALAALRAAAVADLAKIAASVK